MKTTKLITMLLLLAILSFSCGEDDYEKGEDEISNINAVDFLYLENHTYTFEIEFTETNSSNNETENYKMVYVIYSIGNEFYQGKNTQNYSLFETDVSKDYNILADSSILYTHNSLINYSPSYYFTDQGWIPCVDFSKDLWIAVDIEEMRELNSDFEKDYFIKFKTTGKKEKEIVFNFQNKDYFGYEIILNSNINLTYYDENGEVYIEEVKEVTDKLWYVKGLGLVKYNIIEKRTSLNSEIETKREWNAILTKLEK